MKINNDTSKKSALKFIILLGLVSLFADITYEGGRSIVGPYLMILGASAVTVGVVSGLGELIGYSLRLISGYISDRTKQYWSITIIGYIINLLAMPLLALVGRWEMAVILIVMERMGKAIRSPARDVILSNATQKVGQGFGFGLHEALDQIGALLGPLIVAGVLYLKGSYQSSLAVLFVPAIFALIILIVARLTYQNPSSFETTSVKLKSRGIPKVFWIYLGGVSLIAAGYADFPLIAYHFKRTALSSDSLIPIFYAIAMGVDGLSALLFGRLFDRIGIHTLIIAVLFSSFFAPLVFIGDFYFAIIGIVLWGIGMGAQESIMRASVATMVSLDKRGSAYGIFNTGYGLFWFLGSAVMGILYDKAIILLVVFSVFVQLLSIPILFLVKKEIGR